MFLSACVCVRMFAYMCAAVSDSASCLLGVSGYAALKCCCCFQINRTGVKAG